MLSIVCEVLLLFDFVKVIVQQVILNWPMYVFEVGDKAISDCDLGRVFVCVLPDCAVYLERLFTRD